jgi:regulator of protease activity HflC (stomatin/prohibitin superfamily)
MLALSRQRRSFITVVHQAEICFREFLGGNRIRLDPGLQICIPILHTIHRIDSRETGIPIYDLNCFTKDNVPVAASGTLFFRVFDPEKACFAVTDYEEAVKAVGSSSARAIIGRFEYDETIKERERLNNELQKVIGVSIENWGVECTRFEIGKFDPQNKHTSDNLEKQMQAERARRENELNTQANIRTAEGEKFSKQHKADGDFYTSQKISDAQKYDIDKSTESLIYRIHQIKQSLPSLSDEQIMTIVLEEKRLAHLAEIARHPQGKNTYFVDPTSAFPTVQALLGNRREEK